MGLNPMRYILSILFLVMVVLTKFDYRKEVIASLFSRHPVSYFNTFSATTVGTTLTGNLYGATGSHCPPPPLSATAWQ